MVVMDIINMLLVMFKLLNIAYRELLLKLHLMQVLRLILMLVGELH